MSDSTTEVKYIALSEDAKKSIWIRKFVSKSGVVIMVPLHRPKNLDHIKNPNTYFGIIILFARSLIEVMWRPTKYVQSAYKYEC